MYINAHVAIVLWILAIFGLYCLLIKGVYGSIRPFKRSKAKLSIIISARNQQETIEGIVREFILKTRHDKYEDAFAEIVLVDNGSCDHTPEIMKRMSREFGFMEFTKN
jgi:cellulose synthase/poly-beta-1,6-N-acetylglucosamine synthase-like glycosyltransferase